MQKQIIYPGFTTRMLALTIDFTIIFFLTVPIMKLVTPLIFQMTFSDFLTANNITISNQEDIIKLLFTDNFQKSMTLTRMVSYLIATNLISIGFFGIYITFCMVKYSTTIGKRLLNIKIVNFKTFDKPTIWQVINRFLFLWLGLICFPMIVFSKNKRGIHDKIAETLVIKN